MNQQVAYLWLFLAESYRRFGEPIPRQPHLHFHFHPAHGSRAAIQHGWQEVAKKLVQHGDRQLPADLARFVGGMDWSLTDREWLARALLMQVPGTAAGGEDAVTFSLD